MVRRPWVFPARARAWATVAPTIHDPSAARTARRAPTGTVSKTPGVQPFTRLLKSAPNPPAVELDAVADLTH